MVLTELVPVSEVLGVVEGVEGFEGVGDADRCYFQWMLVTGYSHS